MSDVISDLIRQSIDLRRRIEALERKEQERPEVSTADVTNPPTDAELDSAFATPTNLPEGVLKIVDDNNAETAVYLVFPIGSTWWYIAATKAT